MYKPIIIPFRLRLLGKRVFVHGEYFITKLFFKKITHFSSLIGMLKNKVP